MEAAMKWNDPERRLPKLGEEVLIFQTYASPYMTKGWIKPYRTKDGGELSGHYFWQWIHEEEGTARYICPGSEYVKGWIPLPIYKPAIEPGEKIGCEYCRMEANGDFGRDLKPLAMYEGGWTDSNTGERITTTCFEITVMRDRLNICFNCEHELEKIIKYCPMCGRELEGGDNVD